MTFATIQSLLKEMNISSFQKHSDFHILRFKDHLGDVPLRTESRKCDFFQVIITKEHNVDVVVDNVAYTAMSPSITFMAPLQMLSTDVKSVEEAGLAYMLLFNKDFLRLGYSNFELFQKFPFFNINHSPVYFLKENEEIFFHLMETIYKLFQDFNTENTEIVKSYLTILLFEGRKSLLKGEIKNSAHNRHSEIAFSFENLIKDSSDKRVPLSYYAQKLNISTIYLAECVKKATGKTAKQILSEYIIGEATSLLLQSTKTIDEIAFSVGYSSTSNFALFFKKHTGLTPSNYRKEKK